MIQSFRKISKGLIAIFIFAFILRIPSLFEPYWYGDEGIYLTLGLALRKGLVFYRDIHDNKPPLLYLIAALAGSQFWFRFILLGWNLFNIYLIYIFAREIFKKKLPALVSAWFFTILSFAFEGNIANGEIFMIMPTTWAMLTLYGGSKIKSPKLKVKSYFISGVLFSLGFLFKAPAMFSFLAALAFLVFFQSPPRWKYILYLLLGFAFLPLITSLYYWFQKALPQYLTAAFLQNFGYLSSWGAEKRTPLFSLASGFTQRSLVFAASLLIFYLLKKRLSKEFLLINIWFFADLFSSLLSGRPYPHYLIQVAPALAILLIFLVHPKKILEKILTLFGIFVLIFTLFYYKFWQYPVITYYQNFYQFITGQKTKEAYFSFFDSRVNQTYKLAYLIKNLTDEDDYIFIWGNEPYLYALAGRLPVGRYTVAYHIIDFVGWEETIKSISQKQPALIITMEGEKEFAKLKQILKENYLEIAKIEKASIFKKLYFSRFAQL